MAFFSGGPNELKDTIIITFQQEIDACISDMTNTKLESYKLKLNKLKYIFDSMIGHISKMTSALHNSRYQNNIMSDNAYSILYTTASHITTTVCSIRPFFDKGLSLLHNIEQATELERRTANYKTVIIQEMIGVMSALLWNNCTWFLASLLAQYPDWVHGPTSNQKGPNNILYPASWPCYIDKYILNTPYQEWGFVQLQGDWPSVRVLTHTFNSGIVRPDQILAILVYVGGLIALGHSFTYIIFETFTKAVEVPQEIINSLKNPDKYPDLPYLKSWGPKLLDNNMSTYRNLISQNLTSVFILAAADVTFLPHYFNSDRTIKYSQDINQSEAFKLLSNQNWEQQLPNLINDFKTMAMSFYNHPASQVTTSI